MRHEIGNREGSLFFYQGIEGGETDEEGGWECREKRGNGREEE